MSELTELSTLPEAAKIIVRNALAAGVPLTADDVAQVQAIKQQAADADLAAAVQAHRDAVSRVDTTLDAIRTLRADIVSTGDAVANAAAVAGSTTRPVPIAVIDDAINRVCRGEQVDAGSLVVQSNG